MIRTPLRFVLGTALVASIPLHANATAALEDPEFPMSPPWPKSLLPWPAQFEGAFHKVDSARLFEDATEELAPSLLVLAGSDLVLVRGPMSRPEPVLVATGVSDFCVLPPQDGVSRVAISTPSGLKLSAAFDNEPPTIAFPTVALSGSAWTSVTELDAAACGSTIALVARLGDSISRAEISASGLVTGFASLTPGVSVSGVTVGEVDATRPGAEIAFTSGTNKVYCHEWGGTQYYSYEHPRALLDVARIPRGADDVRDSFALIAEWDYGGGLVGDVLVEIVDQHLSAPLFGGAVRVGHFDIGSAGADTRSDFVASSSTSSELFVLHGTAPSPSYLAPFEFRFDPEHWFVALNSATFDVAPVQPFVAMDDFDLDGDGDLALIGTSTMGRGIWFVRGLVHALPGPEFIDPKVLPVYGIDPAPTAVAVTSTVNVPLPLDWGSAPTGQVDKVRIRVWVQDNLSVHVNSTVAVPAQRFPLVSGQVSISGWTIPTPNGADDAILHFELLPLRVFELTGELVKQGQLTFAAGAVYANEYEEYICAYPDEFNPAGLECQPHEPGAPIVTAINRRTVIRPTSLYPQ